MWQKLPLLLDPVLIQIGSFSVRYYGLMYCIALAITYSLSLYRIRREHFPFSELLLHRYVTYALIGVLGGARIGYFLFYNPHIFVENPLSIVMPFRFVHDTIQFTGFSGMSFHGGLIGIILATGIFCRRYSVSIFTIGDLIIPAFPPGYMFGRLGNFINGELYGRSTTSPVGMYFPGSRDTLRHPSQLYEAAGEGLLLFIILWSLRNTAICKNRCIALYLIGYGIIRFGIEFFREPDPQIGYILHIFSLGQIFCLAMILSGGILLFIPGVQLQKNRNRITYYP